MGMIKGKKEYKKFLDGETLTARQAILANCFQCNGLQDSREDCKGYHCPLYDHSPYGSVERGLEKL